MTTKRITEEEISALSVSSLPTRPTAPKAFGGRGYTAAEMKQAFDLLPRLIAERFNLLLEDVAAEGEGSFADLVPTGIDEGHTLRKLFADIRSGSLAGYITVSGKSLLAQITEIKENISALRSELDAMKES